MLLIILFCISGLVNSEPSNKSDDNSKDIVETKDAVNDSNGDPGNNENNRDSGN